MNRAEARELIEELEGADLVAAELAGWALSEQDAWAAAEMAWRLARANVGRLDVDGAGVAAAHVAITESLSVV